VTSPNRSAATGGTVRGADTTGQQASRHSSTAGTQAADLDADADLWDAIGASYDAWWQAHDLARRRRT